MTTARLCLAMAMLALAMLALAACAPANPSLLTTLNHSAALPGDLPDDPLQWQVITSGVEDSAMFTLFGNGAAVEHARTSADSDYPAGSVLALVTWQEQEDSRWFGARIPARVKSVEFVNVSTVSYRAYEGAPFKEVTKAAGWASQRKAYLVSMHAAVMP